MCEWVRTITIIITRFHKSSAIKLCVRLRSVRITTQVFKWEKSEERECAKRSKGAHNKEELKKRQIIIN